MNSFKQSSFTCSNCKKPFLFLILPNKNKIYKHCRQCGKDLYSCIDRSLSTDIYITIHLLIIFALLVMNIINSLKTTVITTQLLY